MPARVANASDAQHRRVAPCYGVLGREAERENENALAMTSLLAQSDPGDWIQTILIIVVIAASALGSVAKKLIEVFGGKPEQTEHRKRRDHERAVRRVMRGKGGMPAALPLPTAPAVPPPVARPRPIAQAFPIGRPVSVEDVTPTVSRPPFVSLAGPPPVPVSRSTAVQPAGAPRRPASPTRRRARRPAGEAPPRPTPEAAPQVAVVSQGLLDSHLGTKQRLGTLQASTLATDDAHDLGPSSRSPWWNERGGRIPLRDAFVLRELLSPPLALRDWDE